MKSDQIVRVFNCRWLSDAANRTLLATMLLMAGFSALAQESGTDAQPQTQAIGAMSNSSGSETVDGVTYYFMLQNGECVLTAADLPDGTTTWLRSIDILVCVPGRPVDGAAGLTGPTTPLGYPAADQAPSGRHILAQGNALGTAKSFGLLCNGSVSGVCGFIALFFIFAFAIFSVDMYVCIMIYIHAWKQNQI